jgi:CDP-glucose 4,6-dehydratase
MKPGFPVKHHGRFGRIKMFNHIYKRKKVFVTGHTGFKGSWLESWLLELGAEVVGFSKDIPTSPSHFKILELESNIKNYVSEICNFEQLQTTINDFKPDIVFHLAAQALVGSHIGIHY